ncbi:hypothetical protein [Roseovarius sp. MMSF_3350]|uniref:hypothetical protein n=1 Tax=Roseovarius sp. MMSF_3350 TaxID=3046706 RepID=UPI00273DB291|nr:hypothetical protein [Roseovarius sp. MMSF_3350]
MIDAWPSRKDFATDVGVSVAAVNKMCEKDSIRGVYFRDIVAASRLRHGRSAVSADDLCRLAARDIVPPILARGADVPGRVAAE